MHSKAISAPTCPLSLTNGQVIYTRELVINFHMTEACNYCCRHCFSRWNHGQVGELFRHIEQSSKLLTELYRFFSPVNPSNPLCHSMVWNGLRLSLVGGEPLLFPKETIRIAHEAKAIGFELSLITNASLLSPDIIVRLAPSLSILGISLDSADPTINQRIGRADRSGRVLSLEKLAGMIALARVCNPYLIIKVNTVVNALNADEDLSEMIQSLRPNKWKLLRVLPVVTDALSITDQQFVSFVERHRHLGNLLSVENHKNMLESYLMIDPCGRFFQNRPTPSTEQPYIYSEKILKVGADAAFSQINFDIGKFASRYVQSFSGEVAA